MPIGDRGAEMPARDVRGGAVKWFGKMFSEQPNEVIGSCEFVIYHVCWRVQSISQPVFMVVPLCSNIVNFTNECLTNDRRRGLS